MGGGDMSSESGRFYEILCDGCLHRAEISSEYNLFKLPHSEKLICSKCNKKNARILSVTSSDAAVRPFETAREFAEAEDPYYGNLSDDTPY
mgnify:CR=1 FL=1